MTVTETVNPEITELRRLAEDADARSAAKWAAASIAAAHGIRGSADPAYIANVIEYELGRFESHPAALIEAEWKGTDTGTGLTSRELLDYAKESEASPGAQSAAIRIVRAYATAIGAQAGSSTPRTLGRSITDVAERIQHYLDIPEQPPEVTNALQRINAHRRTLGMSPLDPVRHGWSDEDVLLEADRIGRLSNLAGLMP